jgi:hypothetical protein
MEQGFWPYHLIPAARASMLRRLMPLDKLKSGACGIRDHAARPFVPVDAVLQGADCFDPHGPLGAEWRAGDSIRALARSPELFPVQRTLSASTAADGSPPTWPSTVRGCMRSARSPRSMASRTDRRRTRV